MENLDRRMLLAGLGLVGAVAAATASAGTLNPPAGPVAPTGKTTDEIEPRVDVQSLASGALALHLISQSGSYYLTKNIAAVAGQNGITVTADNVTIDLNGFSFTGVDSAGITASSGTRGLVVRNGILSGFADGISCDATSEMFIEGIHAYGNGAVNTNGIVGGVACVVRDCQVRGSYRGIVLGDNAVVERCAAILNTYDGITVGAASAVSHCSSTSNGGSGFYGTGSGVSFTNCNAGGNALDGFALGVANSVSGCNASNNAIFGIAANNDCLITNCITFANTGHGISGPDNVMITGCYSTGNLGHGISVAFRCRVAQCSADTNGSGTAGSGIVAGNLCTVEHCQANTNHADGISVGSTSVVLANHTTGNGQGGGPAAGIHVTGSASRIEGNHSELNIGAGFQVDANRNFIARNTARANTLNFVIVAGNRVAQIVVPATNVADITGANAGSTDGFTAVDPWANFTF